MTGPSPLIATILPPREGFGPGEAGAIGMVAHAQAQIAGFRCTVFGGPQSLPFDDVAYRAIRPAWWFPGNTNLRFGAALLHPLSRLGPALVEVHNRPELALFLARWLRRSRVTLFLHNDPRSMRRARRPADRMTLLRRLACVVTVSEYLRGRFLEGVAAPGFLKGAAAPGSSPLVLPNGIDRASLPARQEREPLILFVGRIVPDKAPDVFVSACASILPRLPGWRAEMIGADRFRTDAETGFVRQTRRAAEAAGVRLLGYRDHAAVLAAMARAAIVVVPSRWAEPFGLVALEAMASGAALICSPRGGLPEVAGDAALYAQPEPAALADAILRLAGDPQLRAALEQAGLTRAALFDGRLVGQRLAELRQALLTHEAAQA